MPELRSVVCVKVVPKPEEVRVDPKRACSTASTPALKSIHRI